MSGKRLVEAGTVLALCLLGSAPASAQSRAEKLLATAKTLKCTFALQATGTWDKDGARAEVKPAKLSFQVDAIDRQEGTAHISGMFGPSYAVARFTGNSLHVLLIDNAGPLYVTTVFAKETSAGKLTAVHTRHEFTEVSLPGFTSRPEQYYGECEAVP
jgi:hypothetical protein